MCKSCFHINSFDPTGTKRIRDAWVSEFNKRFSIFRKDVLDTVWREDFFHLNQEVKINNYSFPTDGEKLEQFGDWLDTHIEFTIVNENNKTLTGKHWQDNYIDSAYKKAIRDVSLAKATELATDAVLDTAFLAPIHANTVSLMYSRDFAALEGVTVEMAKQMREVMSESLINGWNAHKTAIALTNRVDKIGITRARILARTETIRTYAESTLNQMELFGEKKVTAMVEWSTAGDHRVCPICASLEGEKYTIKEARGKLPIHPNCRCCWLPVI